MGQIFFKEWYVRLVLDRHGFIPYLYVTAKFEDGFDPYVMAFYSKDMGLTKNWLNLTTNKVGGQNVQAAFRNPERI